MSGIDRIITDGFSFEAHSVRGSGLGASYGDGYAEGIRTGHPEGLKAWKMKVDALSDFEEQTVNAGEFGLQTRWAYLWDLYVRHNVANWHQPFWFRDPKSGRDYLVEIVEEELSYQMFSLMVATVGITLRQRRVYGVESPGAPTTVENPAEI